MIIEDLDLCNDIREVFPPDASSVLGGGYYDYLPPIINLRASVKAFPNGLQTETEAEVVGGLVADLRVHQKGVVRSVANFGGFGFAVLFG
jgi:hypothetical protein